MRRDLKAWRPTGMLAVSILVLACGGGTSEPPPAIVVSVSPSTATVAAGGTSQFTATVTNSTQGVTWSATGGTITGSGLGATYTAPLAGGTYTVRATSVEDATKSGTAQATVTPIVVSLSPATRAVFRGEPVTIAATVTGTSQTGVTWTASCGTVNGTGSSITWTAPETAGPCTVTAQTVFNTAISGTATMTVRGGYLVASLNDVSDGTCNYSHCSLREAITASNADPQADSIHFQVVAAAFGNTAQTITLTSALPVITTPMHIVGPGPDVFTIDAAATTVNQRRVLEVDGAVASLAGVRLRGGISNGGGGLLLTNGADATLTNVMVVENEANGGEGGGIMVIGSTLTLDQVIIDENKATGTNQPGGGLSLSSGAEVTMTGGRIKGNTVANGWGGGIRQLDSKLTLTGTTVEGNSVLAGSAGGGGILAEGTSTLTLDNATINANGSPAGEGGGLRILAGTTGSIVNSTVSNNTSNTGAGMVLGDVGEFTVDGTTINNNTSNGRVGGLWLWGASDVTISNSTIRDNLAKGGGGGGGIYLQGTAIARLNKTVIRANKVTGTNNSGGGIQAFSGTSLIMTDGSIEANQVESGFGAGIAAAGATLTLTNVHVSDNTGGLAIGGGISAGGSTNLTVTGGSFTGNVATGASGGGILLSESTATIQDVLFEGNVAGVQGGGIQLVTSGSVTLTNLTFRNNQSTGVAGAVGVFGTTSLSISNSAFEGNSSGSSGGAVAKGEAAQLTVTDSRFLTNTATLQSGALHLVGTGSATVQRSTFSGNTSITGGGAITNGGPAVIENSVFNGNSAGSSTSPTAGQGGAIFAASLGNTTIRNSTISGNTATTLGGGISVTGPANFQSLTIVGNTAATIGGGIAGNNAGAITIANSVLANNMMGTSLLNCGVAVTATITSQGNNLSDNASCPSFTQASDKLGAAAGLNATLADNGGPTMTHAVIAGSALINSGNPATCTTTDQRGFSRKDACDIGAFEFEGIAPAAPANQAIGSRSAALLTRRTLGSRGATRLKGITIPRAANGGIVIDEVVR